MLENIKKVDKKMIIMMGVVIGIVILLIVAIILVYVFRSKTLSYEKIESKLVEATKEYYEDNAGSLPNEVGAKVEIQASTLSSGKYIKELSEYTEKGVTCNGKVIVTKIEDGYDYVPVLDCGNSYKTVFLVDKLLENVTTSGEGLYQMETVAKKGITLGFDEDGYNLAENELMSGYIFRGENVNNYIQIGNGKVIYRIVKIDGNGDLTLVIDSTKGKGRWDDRYNSQIANDFGINDYSVSRAYETMKSYYSQLDSSSFIKDKAVKKNICIGSRSQQEKSTDGSVECSKVLKGQYNSLLPVYDIMNASLSDKCIQTNNIECMNYNYLIQDSSYWTMTADNINTYSVYSVNNGISSTKANTNGTYRFVYYLSNRLVYVSGSGTQNDPYIVK